MKFHRVTGELPAGVSPSLDVTVRTAPGILDDLSDLLKSHPMTLLQRAERLVSNKPTKITLDVPEAAATETARTLRAMANELDGGK